MPIYEYQCQSCGHQLESFQSMSEAPLSVCPVCSQSSLSRLVSASGFQLKGTGWYVTDFRDKKKSTSDSKTAETKATDPSPQKKEVSSHTSTDSKASGTDT